MLKQLLIHQLPPYGLLGLRKFENDLYIGRNISLFWTHKIYCLNIVVFLLINTGLFEITVGVLTTCHTQYTSDRSIRFFFLFNRTTLQDFVTYLIGALYVHPLLFYKHQHDN
jgi:hypothetical protein